VLNEFVTLTINVTDSDDIGVAGAPLEISSDRGNPLLIPTPNTDNNGQLVIQVQSAFGGTDTIRVSGQGASATHTLLVSTASFAFTTDPQTEIPLNTGQTVRLEWRDEARNPPEQIGKQLTLSTTRGAFDESGTSSVTLVTQAGQDSLGRAVGVATATLRADNAGPAVISATSTDTDVVSTQVGVEFIATVAASIVAQANPSQVAAAGDQSTITVTVRDPSNNLVKNKVVNFDLNDVTGGSISTGFDITDSQGRASTIYTSSSVVSGADAVVISAVVADAPSVSTSVALSVARAELFIQLGTGNDLLDLDETRYALPYSALVTDVESSGVEGSSVDLEAIPAFFYKGFYELRESPGGALVWVQFITSPACPNEDANNNGILDLGEDTSGLGNGNGILDPGNVISVQSPQVTDTDGFAVFQMPYAKQFARWVDVRLEARAAVAGSEALAQEFVTLPILADDVTDEDVAPPGVISPFGTSSDCSCSVEDELPPVRPGCERIFSSDGGLILLALEPSAVFSDAQVLLSLTSNGEPFAGVPISGIVTGQSQLVGSATDLVCTTNSDGQCLLNIAINQANEVTDSATIVYSGGGQVVNLTVTPQQAPPPEPPPVEGLSANPTTINSNVIDANSHAVVLLTYTQDGVPTNGFTINGVVSGQAGVIDQTLSDLTCVTGATGGRGQCLNDIFLNPAAPSGNIATITWSTGSESVDVTVIAP